MEITKALEVSSLVEEVACIARLRNKALHMLAPQLLGLIVQRSLTSPPIVTFAILQANDHA